MHDLLETNKADIESLCLDLDCNPHVLINKHTHSISALHVQELFIKENLLNPIVNINYFLPLY